jgi:hypothetical protein
MRLKMRGTLSMLQLLPVAKQPLLKRAHPMKGLQTWLMVQQTQMLLATMQAHLVMRLRQMQRWQTLLKNRIS